MKNTKIKLILILLNSLICINQINARSIVIDITKFGADKSGSTNCFQSFKDCATYINNLPANDTKTLVLPFGKYKLGIPNGHNQNDPISFLFFIGLKNFTIKGNNSKIFFEDNLMFGSFEKNGNNRRATAGISTNPLYAHNIGTMLNFQNCENIKIESLILNGNCQNYKLGGQWGDNGIQLHSFGFKFYGCENTTLTNCDASYFGCDGMLLGRSKIDCNKFKINNSKFEYNCRQGLSITGCKNLIIDKSKFNYTGFYYKSNPSSGIDIESESEGEIKNIIIKNCELKKNKGMAFITYNTNNNANYSNKISNISFENCTLETGGEFVLEAGHKKISFIKCKIYGTILNGCQTNIEEDGNKFISCLLSDNNSDAIYLFNHSLFYNYSIAGKVTFENCIFDISSKNSNAINFMQNDIFTTTQKKTIDTSYNITLKNCSFNCSNSNIFQEDSYTTIIKNAYLLGNINWGPFINKKNQRKSHIFFDNSLLIGKSNLNLKSEKIIYYFRKSFVLGDGINTANLFVDKGNILCIAGCSFAIKKGSILTVRPGATLVINAESKGVIEGKVIVEKGGKLEILNNETYKNLQVY
jgi:hypothetical protein